uniref:Polyisoprenoid diphosphate/phosphate phosphohydrolase PLPP6 n=1 Tax=Rhinolophus ferrumequinum TaxID=59479 RepID=A0A671EH72_RHIFE
GTLAGAPAPAARGGPHRPSFLGIALLDKCSFPSGHATRAALVSQFILNLLVLAIPLRVLVVLWAFILGLSRVMLGRHNVTDVAFGFFSGLHAVQHRALLLAFTTPCSIAAWRLEVL